MLCLKKCANALSHIVLILSIFIYIDRWDDKIYIMGFSSSYLSTYIEFNMTIMILSYISLTTIKPPYIYIYHGITTIKPPCLRVYTLMGWGLLCLKIPFGNPSLPLPPRMARWWRSSRCGWNMPRRSRNQW